MIATLLILEEECMLAIPDNWIKDSFLTNEGLGRGIVKNHRSYLEHKNVFDSFCRQPRLFQVHLHPTEDEFLSIFHAMKKYERVLQNSPLIISYANKILMGLLFVIEYPRDKVLAAWFGVSQCYVSNVLDEVLPLLVEYFSSYVVNKRQSSSSSRLSAKILYIIDCTIHKTKRPQINQSEHYNGHYHMHGRLSQVLVDFDGYVVAYKTMIPGRCNDSMIAMYNTEFRRIIGKNFALGDPSFQGSGYIVAGFGSSSVNSLGKEAFFIISKQEQRLIEHVNCFVKVCRSINKEDTFQHGEARLLACICISFGLYNLKRSWGYFRGNNVLNLDFQ